MEWQEGRRKDRRTDGQSGGDDGKIKIEKRRIWLMDRMMIAGSDGMSLQSEPVYPRGPEESLMQAYLGLQELRRFLEIDAPVRAIILERGLSRIGAELPAGVYGELRRVLHKHCIDEIQGLAGQILGTLGEDRKDVIGNSKLVIGEKSEKKKLNPRRGEAGICIEPGCGKPKIVYADGVARSRCEQHHREYMRKYNQERAAKKKVRTE